ncbi:MAG TPA: hypothetical protein VMG12_43655, partial [Polyangiaceae bacterium]|nr:hypothetical protein [Polyangiaceae bacterium]
STRRGVAPCAALASAALLAALALGCGAEFDPASEITGLRVLAVKKSLPYARPGEAVDFTMLWHDAEPDRPIPQIAWLAICENPPADLFEACFTQVPELTADDLAARISLPDPAATTPNDRFSFTTSADLITSRPPPPEASTTAYGLSYVFFAACAGQLALDMGSEVPFVCYEELDGVDGFSEGDTRRDSRDFVIGYSAVFAYDTYRNQNPLISGVQFGDTTLWPDSPPEVAAAAPPGAVLASARDLCIGESCGVIQPGTDTEPCLDVLTLDACLEDECDTTSVQPLIDPASAEPDDAASARSAEPLGEQMWVNYYATGGELGEEVRLLNDAVAGFSTDTSTDYEAADTAQVSYVWAVAHDNRGGAEWARLRVCTR